MGLYPLHRVLMENKIGRLLQRNEIVHHIDGNTQNDNIDNLELLTNIEHATLHAMTVDDIECVCPICDTGFSLRPNQYRLRVKRSKYKSKPTCSSKCGGIAGWAKRRKQGDKSKIDTAKNKNEQS
jgi:hypothetical protein